MVRFGAKKEEFIPPFLFYICFQPHYPSHFLVLLQGIPCIA